MKYLLIMLISISAYAATSRDVFIRGKIGNEFDEKKVKVIDSEGQTYFLARHLFPKELTIKQGQSFAIEVHEKELDKVKILKK
jgi:hypothetical protein